MPPRSASPSGAGALPSPKGDASGESLPAPGAIELAVARLLTAGTYLSVALLALGLVAMLVSGISPFATSPKFDPSRIGSDLLAGRAEAFLWLGLVAAIATPTARVVLALARFVRGGERSMVAVALGILAVIGISLFVAGVAGA